VRRRGFLGLLGLGLVSRPSVAQSSQVEVREDGISPSHLEIDSGTTVEWSLESEGDLTPTREPDESRWTGASDTRTSSHQFDVVGGYRYESLGSEGTIQVGPMDYQTDAQISITNLEDGDVVTPRPEIEVNVVDFDLVPSSEPVLQDAGHLHVLLERDPVPVGDQIPKTPDIVHVDDGSDFMTLSPDDPLSGTVRLGVQLGDSGDRAYDATDSVEVEIGATGTSGTRDLSLAVGAGSVGVGAYLLYRGQRH